MRTKVVRNVALAATFGLWGASLAGVSVAREVEGVRDPNAKLQLLFVHSAQIPARSGESTFFIDVLGRGVAFLGGAMVGSAVTKSRESSDSTTYVQQSPHPPCTCNCN